MQAEEITIERKETAIRILITLLFFIVTEILKWVLGAIVLFELAFALITKREPSDRLRRFANRTLSYQYRIVRYLTFNESDRPFPFSDFPLEVEPYGPKQEAKEMAAGEP